MSPQDNVYTREVSLFDIGRLSIAAFPTSNLKVELEARVRFASGFNQIADYVRRKQAGELSEQQQESVYEAEDEEETAEAVADHVSGDADAEDQVEGEFAAKTPVSLRILTLGAEPVEPAQGAVAEDGKAQSEVAADAEDELAAGTEGELAGEEKATCELAADSAEDETAGDATEGTADAEGPATSAELPEGTPTVTVLETTNTTETAAAVIDEGKPYNFSYDTPSAATTPVPAFVRPETPQAPDSAALPGSSLARTVADAADDTGEPATCPATASSDNHR